MFIILCYMYIAPGLHTFLRAEKRASCNAINGGLLRKIPGLLTGKIALFLDM